MELLRVELDDHSLFDLYGNIFPCGECFHRDLAGLGIGVEVRRDSNAGPLCDVVNDRLVVAALLLERDYIADLYLEGRNVHFSSIDGDVTMGNDLTSAGNSGCKSSAFHDVVEPSLNELQEVLAGFTGHSACLLVVCPELLLAETVVVANLLFLLELHAERGYPSPAAHYSLFTWRRSSPFRLLAC